MPSYKSTHKGSQVDNAVAIALNNKNKGNEETPIYFNQYGVATPVEKATTAVENDEKLITAGGAKTELDKLVDTSSIAISTALGTSDVLIPSQNAVKGYVDNGANAKQEKLEGELFTTEGGVIKASEDVIKSNDERIELKERRFTNVEINNNAEMFSRVDAAKRSSFDKSKFTVGNTTITEDGIASGFSTNNFIQPNISFDNSSSVEFLFKKVILKESRITANNELLFGSSNGGYAKIGFSKTSRQLALYDGSTWTRSISYILLLNTPYDMKLTWNGSTYTLYAKLSSENNWNTVSSFNNSTNILNSNLWIGRNSSYTAEFFSGSIDLKQFSITVDGVEVFNGNKTGIDQIKKDDYVNNGATILDTGFVEPLTTTQYIQTKLRMGDLKDKSWSIETPTLYYRNTDLDTRSDILEFFNLIIGDGGQISYSTISKVIQFVARIGDASDRTSDGWKIQYNVDLSKHTSLQAKVDFDYPTGTYQMFVKLDSGNYVSVGTYRPTTANKQLYMINQYPDTYMYIGNNRFPVIYPMDINTMKVYIEGNLVYQPTLRIPYTLSKTNEKIVDATYRDRVQDMYEQFNYTYYYTIGDEPEKYNVQVVGNPTLVGGIASGFSSSNDVLTNYIFNPDGTWKIKGTFTTPTVNPSANMTICTVSDALYKSRININTNLRFGWYLSSNNTSYNINEQAGTQTLQLNTKYYFEWSFNGLEYLLKVSTDKANWNTTAVISSSLKIYTTSNTRIRLGKSNDQYGIFSGSIDLSQFSIEVDGKEVFRAYEPVIVDAYTYPTIEKEAIIDTYKSGINKYTQRADLTLAQQGQATANQAVTFLKPYADLNYSLNLPYSAKTTTGFTPTRAGDWKAEGTITLG